MGAGIKLVNDYMIDDDQNSPAVTIGVYMDGKQNARSFNCTADDCKQATQILSQQYPGTLGFSEEKLKDVLSTNPELTALQHIILTSQIGECCGEPIVIRNRPSFPLLFNGDCHKGCSKKFQYSFYHQGDTIRYYIPHGEKYFQYSCQTVFEIALLEDMTNNTSISATSFESYAKVYNENFHNSDVARLKHL